MKRLVELWNFTPQQCVAFGDGNNDLKMLTYCGRGYASQKLAYGDWKVSETKGVEGYEDVKPVYIHMETDTEKDILTISTSYYEDFSKPFSKRSFSLKDSSTESNPNGEGTVGEVTPEVPTISLSTIHFNDNPTPEKVPSIDIEKTNDKIPEPGEGNFKDKDTTTVVKTTMTHLIQPLRWNQVRQLRLNSASQTMVLKLSVIYLTVSDKTIEGKIDVKDIVWTFKGKKLSVNKDGELTTEDGKFLVLNPGEAIEGKGTLEGLAAGDIHGDNVSVDDVGVHSGKKVGDDDKWYRKVKPKEKPVVKKLADTGTTAFIIQKSKKNEE